MLQSLIDHYFSRSSFQIEAQHSEIQASQNLGALESLEINLPFYTLMGEREIIRTSYGKSHPRIDFPRLANLYMDGKLYLDEMITKTYKIEEINEGFDALERGELARGLVIF